MRTWRKVSWAVAIWTAVMALSAISGPAAVIELVGPTLALGLIAVLWFVGFVALAMVWLVGRPTSNAIR